MLNVYLKMSPNKPLVLKQVNRLESDSTNLSKDFAQIFSWLSSQNQKYHPTRTRRFQTLPNHNYAMGFILRKSLLSFIKSTA